MPKIYKSAPEPDFELADRVHSELKAAHWSDAPDSKGMHAYGYTGEEQHAIDIVVKEATKVGLEAFSDLAGNMYLIKRGKNKNAKTDVIVSHLDTVEKGGAHDGRDGVVAGLAVLSGFAKAGIEPEHDTCLMITRSEESCVNGTVSIGAKAATGKIKTAELAPLKNRKSGHSVLSHMEELGIPIATLAEKLDASPTLFPTGDNAKNLIGFLVEAHIEQGNYCARQEIDVGVVKAIRGNTRFLNAEIKGEAGHSGATFDEDRADAVRAYVELMHSAETWFRQKKAQGHDVVYTPAVVSGSNTSPTTIADHVKFSCEIRSAEEGLLQEFAHFMREKAQQIQDENPSGNLLIKLPKAIISKPAKMDENLIEHSRWVAQMQGTKAGVITSGAGHDTVQFANSGVPSVMLFIKQDDPISHNPRESHNAESFKDTCRIIAGMVMNPPQQEMGKKPGQSFSDYIAEQGAQRYTPGQWRS
jgi:N-carbamoyl-L-amino-acid hydrolase